MKNERYDLVFRGDILLDHSLEQVKQRLQKLLKADAKQVERLFSGRPVVLKRGLEAAAGQKYLRVLEQAGARARLVPCAEPSAPNKEPSAPNKEPSAPNKEPSAPNKEPSVANTKPPGVAVQSTSSDNPSVRARTVQSSSRDSSGLSLAPLDGPLLKPGERPRRTTPLVVNIEGLSLRPVGGDLLDPAERRNPQTSDQVAPDYSLSDPGSDLLAPEERHRPAPVELDLEDWGLAEVGEDLLREQERAKAPPVPVLSDNLSLAPVGTELEGLPREPAPSPPDTSGLGLAD